MFQVYVAGMRVENWVQCKRRGLNMMKKVAALSNNPVCVEVKPNCFKS